MKLPYDIYELIVKKLDLKDLLICRILSKKWTHLIKNTSHDQPVVINNYNFSLEDLQMAIKTIKMKKICIKRTYCKKYLTDKIKEVCLQNNIEFTTRIDIPIWTGSGTSGKSIFKVPQEHLTNCTILPAPEITYFDTNNKKPYIPKHCKPRKNKYKRKHR